MKKLIIVLGLMLSLPIFAQDQEAEWKQKFRSMITPVVGVEWTQKILGPAPVAPTPEIVLPTIPTDLKQSTSVESYTKQQKDPTEYDRLPNERKRQFDYKFIKELFLVTRKTDAKDEDLSNWLNTLDQGGSREGIYQALVLDDVYASLEAMEEKPTQRLLDFCLSFSQGFLGQTFKSESLSQLNLYSLKRIFTEKGLDLFEYYETKDLDSLYRWYAVVSSKLAQDYSPLLKSEIRSEPSAKYHYEWAKGMPVQHIKSEFIIKFHQVMNGLQLLQ